MDMSFTKIKSTSQERLEELRKEISKIELQDTLENKICVFACGSLGRLEMTEQSDLDLFFISNVDWAEGQAEMSVPTLDKYLFFLSFTTSIDAFSTRIRVKEECTGILSQSATCLI